MLIDAPSPSRGPSPYETRDVPQGRFSIFEFLISRFKFRTVRFRCAPGVFGIPNSGFSIGYFSFLGTQ
jgi:hypothetical protein